MEYLYPDKQKKSLQVINDMIKFLEDREGCFLFYVSEKISNSTSVLGAKRDLESSSLSPEDFRSNKSHQ